MMRALLLVPLLVLSAGCTSTRPTQHGTGVHEPMVAQAEYVQRLLTGSFRSNRQATEAEGAYADVRLDMVPIWTDLDDGPWLYVEQALATMPDRPYRQRIYRLEDQGAYVVSRIYGLPDPSEYVGAWKVPESLDALSRSELTPLTGCDVVLRPGLNGEYFGSTEDGACETSFRGASYATSHIILNPSWLLTWDRGFDSSGAQVWGSEIGPYLFERTDP